ncbi:MAG: hypothetical protein NC112_05145 [Oxalobacter formigenes]|nr:hypothetical protein [Oxalobacter formigenes]
MVNPAQDFFRFVVLIHHCRDLPELCCAHQENDRAVMQAYGFDVKNTTEAGCAAELMRLYQAMTATARGEGEEEGPGKLTSRRKAKKSGGS